MKRSDLKVGDELFYAKPYEWSRHCGSKTTVLAVEPYGTHKFARGDARFHPSGKGGGVLVEIHQVGFGPRKDVVPLGHLRGLYATVAAEMKVKREALAVKRMAAHDEREAIRANADAVADRARVAGVEVFGVQQGGDLIALTPAALAALLDRISSQEG